MLFEDYQTVTIQRPGFIVTVTVDVVAGVTAAELVHEGLLPAMRGLEYSDTALAIAFGEAF